MPAITLYEYLSRTSARDLTNTVLAKLIKLEALVKLNLFTDAIVLLNRLTRGERLPHFIDDKYINGPGNNNSVKYTEFGWDSSKPVFDFNNLRVCDNYFIIDSFLNWIEIPSSLNYKYLTIFFCSIKCLEATLSLKLSKFLIKLYGPHLVARYYLVQSKLFVQIASCLPCLPNLEDF